MAELFDSFEINADRRWPRVLRTLAGSVVVHALLVAAIVFVPSLRSALHLVGVFAGADYVDEDYALADVRDRATIIRLSQDKLYYPPGYFTVNPTAPRAAEAEPTPRPTPNPTPKPTPKATPTPDAEPSPAVAQNADAAQAEGTPAPKTEEEMKKAAEGLSVKAPPKVNARPFKDLLAKAKTMVDKGELDLSGSITLTIEADRNDDGTLSNIEVVGAAKGDPKLKALAVEFVQVLSASRALAVLEGTRRMTMTVRSTPAHIGATVTTRTESAERAKEMESGYNLLLALGRLKKGKSDEGTVYQNTKVTSNGNNLTVTFGMSRPAVTKMLAKHVPAAASKGAPAEPKKAEPEQPVTP
ncbi:MAG TPA: hypothetical protein VGV38_19075 [Pyrinomonadaceae bacterium]|nr:hypothetical protein [Pyrinomonadaceae bacterium]